MGGGKGGSKTPPPSQWEQAQGMIGLDMYNSTNPLRQGFLDLYGQLFGIPAGSRGNIQGAPGSTGSVLKAATRVGGKPGDLMAQDQGAVPTAMSPGAFDPSRVALFQPLYDLARTQNANIGNQAREAVLQSGATGGARQALLAQAGRDTAKAKAMSEMSLNEGIFNQLFSGGQAAAFGGSTGASQSLGSAGAMAAQRQQAALQAQSAQQQGKKQTGTALGLGLAMAPFTFGASAAGAGGASLAGFAPSSGWAAPMTFF
jgi:hypothetical protein